MTPDELDAIDVAALIDTSRIDAALERWRADLAAIRERDADAPEGTRGFRNVRMSEELIEHLVTRSDSGLSLVWDWGEPQSDGFYEPLVRVDATDSLIAAERARIGRAVEGLPAHLIEQWIPAANMVGDLPLKRVEFSPSTVTLTRTGGKDGFVDRAAVLRIIEGDEA